MWTKERGIYGNLCNETWKDCVERKAYLSGQVTK